MTVKELKEIIKENLSILDFKFKSELGGGGFKKRSGKILYDIGFGILNYGGEYKLGWAASIRFIDVEEIKENAGNWEKDRRGNGGTLSIMDTSPNYMNGRISVPYEIKKEEDVLTMLKKIEPFIYEKAFPFFEQYKTIADLDNLLNRDPYEELQICPTITIRSKKAIAAAWLNNNPEYEKLVQIYRKLQEGLPFNHEFEQVVAYLERMPQK